MIIRHNYKLCKSKSDVRLHDACNVSGIIWNHCIALQRRYYRFTGKYVSKNALTKHIRKLRRQSPKYALFNVCNSMSIGMIIDRLDRAYVRFFKGLSKLPKFRKVKLYRSFDLWINNGFKLLDTDSRRYGKVRILGQDYKFHYHRALDGELSSITIIRKGGRFWLSFIVKVLVPSSAGNIKGKTAAFDFGIKTFLTKDDGTQEIAPEFFKHNRRRLATAQRKLSRKVKGSNNHKRATLQVTRLHEHIANQRSNYHWQLAHKLCNENDTLIFEDLNLSGMRRLWGRKISDLGFSSFLRKLEWVAQKTRKTVIYIDRLEPTSKKCSGCGNMQEISLRERVFKCNKCNMFLDRDHNAAKNIKRAGMACCQRESKTGSPAILPTAHSIGNSVNR